MALAPTAHELLVDACPGAAGLHRAELGLVRTPVQAWEAGSWRLGVELWVKRDDMSTAAFGGNKPRKLEYLIGDALARGFGSLVTLGGCGSDHVVAVAHFAQARGLRAWAATFDQPDTPLVRRAQDVLYELGMRQIRVPGRPLLPLAAAIALLRAPKPYWIGPGGSSLLGVVGFVAAGLELADQVRSGEMPPPRAVVVALGSGGTAAGLALGFALAGVEVPVLAVRVVEPWLFPPFLLRRLVRRSARFLERLAGSPIANLESAPSPVVVDGFLGRGYGWPTPEGEDAVRLAAEDGLPLETTYSGKAMAALLAGAGLQDQRGPVLFWLTWGGPLGAHGRGPKPGSP
jgi:D-cysteine desulfhydrase